jgi:photosystem II stability/assembly factor-like uncharacterized protein
MRLAVTLLALATAIPAIAQDTSPYIQMEQSTTAASLRGIHAAGPGVAWASGTNGTVLRTEDAGFVWQGCAMPPGAEKLDFRGIWAWGAMTAIVMSSGPGDQSRLYKTTDGCETWKLLLANPDKDGFWDAIAFYDKDNGYLLGDPVDGKIFLMRTKDGGSHWSLVDAVGLEVSDTKLGFFAASNSSIALGWDGAADPPWLATGSAKGKDGSWKGPFVLVGDFDCAPGIVQPASDPCFGKLRFHKQVVPLAGGSDAAGIFSFDLRYDHGGIRKIIAVGGNYQKPNEAVGVAAWSLDGKPNWVLSVKQPHGYRSAVQYDLETGAWITAGPNGTDYSRDDGKTWRPLDNGAWNAISLPYLVGPNGRIGKLVLLPAEGQNTRSTKPQTGAKTR